MPRPLYYVFRNSTGRLSVAMVSHEETVEVFASFSEATAFRDRNNGVTGWQRELVLASEQARRAA